MIVKGWTDDGREYIQRPRPYAEEKRAREELARRIAQNTRKPSYGITVYDVLLFPLRVVWWILCGIIEIWAHAGDNLTERDYAQWFYGTGKYANKE